MIHESIDKIFTVGDLSTITTYKAGTLQASMNRALQKECDSILKPYGITKMQWLLIGAVLDAGNKGARLTELSKSLSTTMSYVTTALNLLESKSILVRTDSETDSRSKLITINDSFMPKCAEIESTLRDGLQRTIYAQISPDDFKTYMKVIMQLSSLGTH